MPLLLGGDHSITLPEVTALAAQHGPVGLIHFDTHTDTAAELWGQKLSHGTPMYRMVEEGHVDPTRYVQIGLRGYWPGEAEFAWQRERGITSFFAHDVRDQGIRAVVAQTLSIVGEGPVMLTVDVDVLDPAFAPGTGTPEPGGLTSTELLLATRLIAAHVDLVGRRRGRGGANGGRIGRHHRAGGRTYRPRDPHRHRAQAPGVNNGARHRYSRPTARGTVVLGCGDGGFCSQAG